MTSQLECDAGEEDLKEAEAKENRQLLITVDNGLDSKDVALLKFLLRDKLTISKLERIVTGLDLFSQLEEAGSITVENNDILAEALCRIHRIDLVKRLKYESKEVRNWAKKNSLLSPFRVILFKVAEEITSEEFKKMKFLLAETIPRGKSKNMNTVFDLLAYLETDEQVTHENVDVLNDVLQQIDRGDLAKMIKDNYLGDPFRLEKKQIPNFPLSSMKLKYSGEGMSSNASLQSKREKMERPPSPNVNKNYGNSCQVPQARGQPIITALTDPILQQLGMDLANNVDILIPALGGSPENLVSDNRHAGYIAYEALKMWRDHQVIGASDKQKINELAIIFNRIGFQHLASLLNGVQTHQNGEQIVQNVPVQSMQRDEENMETSEQHEISNESLLSSGKISSFPNEYLEQQRQKPAPSFSGITIEKTRQPMGPSMPFGLSSECSENNEVASHREAQIEEEREQARDQPPAIEEPEEERIPGQTASILPQVHRDLEPDLPSYKMDAKPRGYCVIINNKVFEQNLEDPHSQPMPPRNGTDIDRDNLKWLFEEKMNFHVQVYNNLKDFEMVRVLVNISMNVNHDDYDCFVCCILSHGALGHVYGTNCSLVRIDDMTSAFKSQKCPSLAGKPKLFFIQACQGREKQEGVEVYESDGNLETDNSPQKTLIPDEADFLLGYATVPGFVSYRSRSHGSWYIQKLVEMLDKFHKKYDLMSIMVKINEEVSRANANLDGGLYKQTPAPQVTLRKKIYFR
ncbi:hypothetical protein ScPMuIL_016974 [Solemya velum]